MSMLPEWVVTRFWATDQETLDSLRLIIAAGLIGFVFVYLPLRFELFRARSARRGLRKALKTREEVKQDAVAKALSNSGLSGRWNDFARRWRDAKDSSG